MPANCRPTKTSENNVRVVHVQNRNRSPSNGRQPQNPAVIPAPSEMFMPSLIFRMKKCNDFPGHEVCRFCRNAFKLIATMAGQAQIFPHGFPTQGFRNDMVNDKACARIRHCRPAISTKAPRFDQDPLAEPFRNVPAHSNSKEGWERGNPRHFRSKVAWAFLSVSRRASSPKTRNFSFSAGERTPRWLLVNKVLYARCFSGDNRATENCCNASLSKDSSLSSSVCISSGISSARGGTASAKRSARNCSNGFRAITAPRRKRRSISSEIWRVTV